MTDSSKHILFVCTGNLCRSPIAERLFRHRVGAKAGWTAESAGTVGMDGSPATALAIEALAEWDIDLSDHVSRSLTPDLVDNADLIVVMTQQHRDQVAQRFSFAANRVALLSSFGTAQPVTEIQDPIGLSSIVYRNVRDNIDSAVSDLILHLMEHGDLEVTSAPLEHLPHIALGADHAGFELKEHLKAWLLARHVQVEDVGCYSTESVDYPDYASEVARRVAMGSVDQGILVCTTGIGMDITANKFPRVRAALCTTPDLARRARVHNNANVLVLGSSLVSTDEAEAIAETWLESDFEAGGRHERRVRKIPEVVTGPGDPVAVYDADPEVYRVLRNEAQREQEHIELVASENYVSPAVRQATGSVLTNKYAEGYPGKRVYPGCGPSDEAERLAIERARELFGAEHVNVQPYSGSAANMMVLFAAMQPGDTFLAMDPAHGGHLTHGHEANFSGRLFHPIHYGTDRETEQIDYDQVAALAEEHRPKLLCAGASTYSRIIDFQRMRSIADSVGACLLVDMAHVAGLVAGGCYPNPVPLADFVTTSTHKSLRGPRGGMILCRRRFAEDIDHQVFPGFQGGPLMHIIAAKAVCLHEALQPEFKVYAARVVRNARALARALSKDGPRIVSGGTDTHLLVADLGEFGVTGRDATRALLRAGITVSRQAIPFDKQGSLVASGIRLGTPAATTRGMGEGEMAGIGALIKRVLKAPGAEDVLDDVRASTRSLAALFPVP